MNSSPALSIIIPVFNKWKLTLDCLVSLKKNTPEELYEVIVVDNASSDETSGKLAPFGQELFGKRFSSIRNAENKNFGPACNQGAQAAEAPLLLFLNNDTLLTPDWLPPLLEAMQQDDSLGAITPLLLYADNTVQHLGVTFFLKSIWHLYQHYPRAHPVVSKKRYLQAVTGAAMLISKELFWDCGGFYEEYKNGFEDIDLCMQIKARGKKMRCIPESVVYHLESQTPGRKSNEDNNAQLLTKRFQHAFKYDAHIHAFQDKFNPAIDDYAGLSFLLPETESRALQQEAEQKTFEWVHNKLCENPGWLDGARLLKRSAEEQGNYKLALNYALWEHDQYTSFAGTENLLRLAKLNHDDHIISRTQDLLEHLTKQYTGTPSPIEETLRLHFRRALDAGDRTLAALIEKKLAYVRNHRLPGLL